MMGWRKTERSLVMGLRTPAWTSMLSSLIGGGRVWSLLGKTVVLGVSVTIVALMVGVSLALFLATSDVLGRGVCLVAHLFPLFLPPFFSALGWFYLLVPPGTPAGSWHGNVLFSPLGMVLVLGLVYAPAVTGLTLLGLRGIDRAIEEAGLVTAPFRRVLFSVLLPLAWPSVALASLLVFALSVSELGVPSFLRVQTYPALLFSRLGGVHYAPGEAIALMVPLFVLALTLLAVERRVIGRRSFASLDVGGKGLRIHRLGPWRLPATVAVWTLAMLPSLPVFAITARSGLSGLRQAKQWIGPALENSLTVAFWAATLAVTIGLVLGHALARKRRFSGLADGLAMLGFIAPGALIGVGIIALWNHGATQFVYAGPAVLVVALVGRYAIVGSRTVAAAVSHTAPDFEDAAAASGSGYLRTLLRIVGPMHCRALVAAWLLTLVFCLRDLSTVVIIYPPGGDTLSVRIFTLEANGPPAAVAGLALIQVLTTAAILVAGLSLLRLGSRTARSGRRSTTGAVQNGIGSGPRSGNGTDGPPSAGDGSR